MLAAWENSGRGLENPAGLLSGLSDRRMDALHSGMKAGESLRAFDDAPPAWVPGHVHDEWRWLKGLFAA